MTQSSFELESEIRVRTGPKDAQAIMKWLSFRASGMIR